MKNRFFQLVTLCAVAALTSGCARQISPNVYKASHVGEASRTYSGVVVSMRTVEVEEGERLEENGLGLMGGGLAGGVAGSFVGKGHGNVAAAGLGAVLGAVGGALLEKEVKKQNAYEYVVKLTDGSALTVVQGMDTQFQIGQKVLVIVSNQGRSRVIADNGVSEAFKSPASNVNIHVKRS